MTKEKDLRGANLTGADLIDETDLEEQMALWEIEDWALVNDWEDEGQALLDDWERAGEALLEVWK